VAAKYTRRWLKVASVLVTVSPSAVRQGLVVVRSYYKKGGTVKDACYHKVKAQYRVFPSAYASGAIAKCRKKKAGKK
jgi:hypothetical protein